MDMAQDLITDQFEPMAENGNRLTTWYAQGHSDGLGDRLLMFDNTSAPSWEILRFKPWLGRDARFEAAVRQRVDKLSSFRHPAFPAVRPITELGQEEGLAVVSTHVAGVSLVEGLKKPRSATFAVRLLRQLVPALAAFQQHAPGMSHGALTLDRLVLTAEGRLMIREHMVGSALESLELPLATLWAEFGILVPASWTSARPMLDERCDVFHVGVIVLSLMIGRSLGPDDYPDKIAEMLDQIEDRSIWHEPETFRSVRRWVERALQIGDDVFATAREASAAVADLQEEPQRPDPPHARLYLAPKPRPAAEAAPTPELEPVEEPPAVATKTIAFPAGLRSPRVMRWATVVIGLIAVGEAAYIGGLLLNGRGQSQPSASAAAPATPPPTVRTAPADVPQLTPPPVDVSAIVPTTALPTLTVTKAPDPTVAKPAAAPPPIQTLSVKSGGFKITAPIEVHVLEGERLLGSSEDGPIIAPAGRHELEFVNSAIGFRVSRVVDIKPGEIASLPVNVPNGTLNINATPWAAVSIDGNAYGETPLGNISIAPGEHEIVFRHPQLGEKREKALVRPGASTRIAVTLK
jgi:hypothetical protein